MSVRRVLGRGFLGAYRYGVVELAKRFFERQRAVVATVLLAFMALTLFGVASFRSITEERDRARTR